MGNEGVLELLMRPPAVVLSSKSGPKSEPEAGDNDSTETAHMASVGSFLRITQRLRLDPPKLEDVTRRMASVGSSGYCLLLTTTSSKLLDQTDLKSAIGDDGSDLQQKQLKTLIVYLKSKEAAGVINLNTSGPNDVSVGHLYAFPPL